MLSRYQQQTNNNGFNVNVSRSKAKQQTERLTLSYDLNNYQPLLSHLQSSEDPRWILFIAPPGKPNFQFLQQSGINKSRIITLNQKQLDDPDKIFKDALASNNYAAVIHWVNNCDTALIDEINQLTAQTETHCFVYCAQ
ncbi:MAG: hypothetical protein GY951_17505 [Psychromonas sp.]|nr:hypothetical protein [Alteromonadales bacterium]MCP5079834.1 hypothetical protein [Psychromonas sp.]